MDDLRIDKARTLTPETGICVRAINSDEKWASVDIAWLDRESLLTWLRGSSGDNPLAENVVCTLLGHYRRIIE
jgi:hypothetical protein